MPDLEFALYCARLIEAAHQAADTLASEEVLSARAVYARGLDAPFTLGRLRTQFSHVGNPETPEKVAMNLDQLGELVCAIFAEGAHFGATLVLNRVRADVDAQEAAEPPETLCGACSQPLGPFRREAGWSDGPVCEFCAEVPR